MANVPISVGGSSLVILFDADNTSTDYVKPILDACTRYGRAVIKRAYGDWTESNLSGWGEIFREFGIKPIQQFRFTSGKNITDSAMTIDAMDILHAKNIDVFVLVSSDSDFTGLATRIREEGMRVIGVGRRTTARAFVNACDEFLLIENLVEQASLKEGMPVKPVLKSTLRSIEPKIKEQGKELLVRATRATQDESGSVKGAALAIALRRLDPAFDPRTYGVYKLADFVELYPEVLRLEGRRTSTDPTFKSEIR
jgi:NYN domain/OST-HTH/LOTUS domain